MEALLLPGISSTIWPIEPHTKAKHEIQEKYLKAWIPILSSWSGRIIYIDGFAGPGIYTGGEEGSPVIALRTITEHTLRNRFNEIILLFIEKNVDRAKKLEEVLQEGFPSLPENVKYHVLGAEFAPTLEQVLDHLEEKGVNLAPTLAFLDPFGFSGLPMNLIGRMMNYRACEVLVTFMAGFVRRFTDELRQNVLNELFACEEWCRINELDNSEDRLNFLLDLYVNQLKEVGGASYVRNFEMIGSNNQVIYYLIYGTKHVKGLEVMKDAMWKVDRRGLYRFSDRTDVNQRYLIDYQDENNWISQAAELIYHNFRGRTVQLAEIKEFTITSTPFRFRKSILKYLETCEPPKICDAVGRSRKLSYPEGCSVTFSE